MSNQLCIEVGQTIVLRSLTEMPPIIDKIMMELDELGYSRKERFGIRLALEEAIVNAVKHGNRNDPSKTVVIRYQASWLEFIIEIEDEGRGFRLERVPDPLAAQNLERPGGRGLLLMDRYMTHVQYNEIGNRVTMRKVRS
jgi:serine/threonine-protein kinase RsbW